MPPGTPSVPYLPLHKPADAVGAVVQFTTIPAAMAKYGQDPLYYPGLAHVIMLTALGALPSIRATFNPQVVLPIPQQVVSIVLDLAPGVEAQVQWLRAPK